MTRIIKKQTIKTYLFEDCEKRTNKKEIESDYKIDLTSKPDGDYVICILQEDIAGNQLFQDLYDSYKSNFYNDEIDI